MPDNLYSADNWLSLYDQSLLSQFPNASGSTLFTGYLFLAPNLQPVTVPNVNLNTLLNLTNYNAARLNFENSVQNYTDSGFFGQRKSKKQMEEAASGYLKTIDDLKKLPGIENLIPDISKLSSALLLSDMQSAIDARSDKYREKLNNSWTLTGLAAMGIAGKIFDLRDTYNGAEGNLAQGLDASFDAASGALLKSNNPYAMAAGAAMKVLDFANKVIPGSTDGMTKTDAFLDSSWGAGLSLGLSKINAWAGNTTDKFQVDLNIKANLGSSYSDTYNNLDQAASIAGKKYGFLSSGAYDRAKFAIEKANTQLSYLSLINQTALDSLLASTYDGIGARNQMSLNGGYQSLRAAKLGMKLKNLKFATLSLRGYKRPVIKEPDELEETLFLKEGGSFNVIPEGALHKNKHNMEDAEGLTKKGIPVVTEEDGKKVLQAEIEVNEIIFRLEVTEELEKLAKEGTEEAAIKAGKLLTKEILHNTHDNTGLIEEV